MPSSTGSPACSPARPSSPTATSPRSTSWSRGSDSPGILDLERLRLAPAAFDAAWFRLLVRHHHPERWPDAGPPLLAALGLPDDEATVATLDDLAVLACLERLAALPRRSPGRLAWAVRVREQLAGIRQGDSRPPASRLSPGPAPS